MNAESEMNQADGLGADEDARDAQIAAGTDPMSRELHCECGQWVLVPSVGEIVECNCGTRYEAQKGKGLFGLKHVNAVDIDAAEGQGRR